MLIITLCHISHFYGQKLPTEWEKEYVNLLNAYFYIDAEKINKLGKEKIRYEKDENYLHASYLGYLLDSIISRKSTPVLETKGYAWHLTNLSCLYYRAGLSPQAIYYGLEAEKKWFNLRENNANDENLTFFYLNSILNLANFYQLASDVYESDKWINYGLTQLIKYFPYYDDLYLRMLHTKANNYDQVGRKEEALAIVDSIVKNTKYVKEEMLIDLAQFQHNCGQTDQAIITLTPLIIKKKDKGLDHSISYANLLNRLAVFKQNIDVKESISLTLKAIDIMDAHQMTYSRENAQYLSNLACYYYAIGNKSEAVDVEERSYKIWSEIERENDPFRLGSLRSLSILQYENGIEDEAVKNMIHATRLYDENMRYSMMTSANYDRQKIWEGCRSWYQKTIPQYAYHIKSESLNFLAYDAMLLSKGLLLNTERTLLDFVESGSPELKRVYEEWQNARHQLNSPHPFEKHEMLLNNAQKAEILFIHNCRVLKNDQRLSVRWHDVQAKLNNEDVAIELCSFEDSDDKYIYFALVLKKNMPSPLLVPLFEEKQLKAFQNNYWSKDMATMIWKPLYKYIQGTNNIYFSPSGELHNIPIEYLPHWEENCLMSDKWNIYRLSSTREIALTREKNPIKNAYVFGGMKYGMTIDSLSANSRKYRGEGLEFVDETISPDSLRQRGAYSDLPGTKVEAKEIDKTLKRYGVKTELMTDTLATESAFKYLSGKKINLLHIATHGFYYTDVQARYKTHLDFLRVDEHTNVPKEDLALKRSGLLFSGANHVMQGVKIPKETDDGCLTAYEISHLDLRNMDFVVLAACQTGLGEVKGDGVFGLQRGFKKAGVNSLLMSLWNVDDDATRLLMTRFYDNIFKVSDPLTGKKYTKYGALKEAQKYVREYKKKNYKDPRYWAGFILLDAVE